MSVAKTRYEIEIFINPLQSDGDDFDDDYRQTPAVCGKAFFGPAGRILRGAFDAALLSSFDTNEKLRNFLAHTRRIPGERVWIDLNKKKWGVYDPLHNPTDANMKRQAHRVQEAMKRYFTNGNDVRFNKSSESPVDTVDVAKNVLYWMRRLVDAKHAFVVEGNLPKLEEIKEMPGRRDPTQGFPSSDPETKAAMARFDDYVEETAAKK